MNKQILALYPYADLGNSQTGGQVYDSRFISFIKETNPDIKIFNETNFNLEKGVSPIKLMIQLSRNILKLRSFEVLIYSTALFPYYILPFLLLKIVNPKIKIYGIHHHFRFQEQRGLRKKIYKFLELLNLRQCTKVICPCPYTKDVLVKNWKKAKYILLENAFKCSSQTKSNFIKYKFLYVGTIYQRKGIIFLLKAIASMTKEEKQDMVFDLVGNIEDTEYTKTLKKFICQTNQILL